MKNKIDKIDFIERIFISISFLLFFNSLLIVFANVLHNKENKPKTIENLMDFEIDQNELNKYNYIASFK